MAIDNLLIHTEAEQQGSFKSQDKSKQAVDQVHMSTINLPPHLKASLPVLCYGFIDDPDFATETLDRGLFFNSQANRVY